MARRRTLGKKRKSQNTRGKKRGRTYRKMRQIRRAGVPEEQDPIEKGQYPEFYRTKEDLLIHAINTFHNHKDLLKIIKRHIANGANINKISPEYDRTPLDAINETIVNNVDNINPKKKRNWRSY